METGHQTRTGQAATTAPRSTVDDLRVAREVQTRLLRSEVPSLRTLDCGGRSLPALAVGGDYLDFFGPAPGRFALAVGDVSGKGVSAALMMASLQASLRSHACADADDLPRLLRSVNRQHFECTAPQHYASLFFGIYYDAFRRLRYVNCGHNPALLVRADGHVDRLGATATVLGMFERWTCSVAEAVLAPGDVLSLFTDGVTEATDARGRAFGEARLIASIRRHRDLPAESMSRVLLREVRWFAGGRQGDDMTLVVARCDPRARANAFRPARRPGREPGA